MKVPILLVVTTTLILLAGADAPDTKPAKKRITADELNSMEVMGDFGFVLGDCFQVEADIVTSDEFKANAGRYLLDLKSINNKPCNADGSPVIFTSRCSIPSDRLELIEEAEVSLDKQPTVEEIDELEREYVGHRFKLLVYETGGFVGLPSLPKGHIRWQGPQWHFETHLVVVDILNEKKPSRDN